MNTPNAPQNHEQEQAVGRTATGGRDRESGHDTQPPSLPDGEARAKPAERSREREVVYRALTIQALRMRNEVFRLGGMDRDTFTDVYLGGLGRYERRVAREEGIEIEE